MTEFGLERGSCAQALDAQVPEWCVSLPGDARLAAATLLESEAILEATRGALPGALKRLDSFGREPTAIRTFDVGKPPGTPHGAELANPVIEFGAGGDLVSAGAGPSDGPWRPLLAAFRAYLERLTMAVAPCALVRTYVGDRCVGLTVIRQLSDLRTISPRGLSAEEAALEDRAVALVLATRITLLRSFSMAVRGAVLLSATLATPVGPLLALPTAWQIIEATQARARVRRGTR